MNKQIFSFLLATILIVVHCPLANAQSSISDSMLEKRVSEEVAEEGLSLARLGLRVVVLQQKKGGARVEIVETSTGRTLMTRSIKRLSNQSEAMIAELTLITSALLREHAAGSKGDEVQGGAILAVLKSDSAEMLATRWSVAMAPTEILARHRPESIHLIVLPSAELAGAAREAADELARAYRTGGVAKVQGPSLATSSDAGAIVKEFASSSSEELALLSVRRVEDSLRAVVTIYDKRGDVITAMSLTAGVALEASSQDGIYLNSGDTIGTIKNERSAAMDEYRREYVAMTSLTVAGVGYVGNIRYAHKGVMGGPLSGAAFYRAVGREDYALRYENVNDKISHGYWIAGAGMLGITGFGTWAFVAAVIDSNRSTADQENGTGHADWQTPTLLTVLSAGATIGGFWYAAAQDSPHAVNETGRIELAKAYNEGLRTRLGLSEEETGSLEQTVQRYNLRLQPYANASGGGLGLGGSF